MRVLIEGLHDPGRSILDAAACFPFEADDGSGRFLLFVDEPLPQPVLHAPRRDPLTTLSGIDRQLLSLVPACPQLHTVSTRPSRESATFRVTHYPTHFTTASS